MLASILNKYNPKDSSSHGILKYFSEGLTEDENIIFVEEIFKSGSWVLATEISRTILSEKLRHKIAEHFFQIFDNWVSNRIEFSNTISTRTKNPYITMDLRFEFSEALLSIKNLGFLESTMMVLEKLVLHTNPKYLRKFLEGAFFTVIEEFEERDIEIFLSYFIKIYINNRAPNIQDFLYNSLNGLAFTHKIYYLSKEFIELLNEVSHLIQQTRDPSNSNQLLTILLTDLIQHKKLELSNSKFDTLIKATLDCLEKGMYENLDFLLFLKRFNYQFEDYNVALESEALFSKLNEMLLGLQRKIDVEKHGLFHHLLNSSDEYFELLLFYQELTTEEDAEEYIGRFINLIDEIREVFSSMLWYDEFQNFTPVSGEVSSETAGGFEVKIDENYFNNKIIEKNLHLKLSKDFILKFAHGFLHAGSLAGYPNSNVVFRKQRQPKTPLTVIEKGQLSEINKFYISKLNYSASNKKNVLILIPFKEYIEKVIIKFQLKGFFSSIELFLVEKANIYLSIPSPFTKKLNSLKIIIPPKYFTEYNTNISEVVFWKLLQRLRPFLYETIYLNHKMTIESMEKIGFAFLNNQTISGVIKYRSTGGMIVDIFGIETFLPGSQLDVKPVTDYDSYLGRTIDVKVIKIDEPQQNAIVSHRVIIESGIELQREQIYRELERGQILEGTIKNITSFGAFVDLGGVDGLLYVTNITWGRISHPNELLTLNQQINVVILEYDYSKKRINLGYKQLHPNPWDTLDTEINIGHIISGKVVNIEDYGVFVEITSGVEGLIHISEISKSLSNINHRELFIIGEKHQVVILTLDKDERKMSLGLIGTMGGSWPSLMIKYAVGTKHSVTVRNVTSFGVFVKLEENLDGLIHISNLSWDKIIRHPLEIAKPGDVIDAIVLNLDEKSKRVSLGHKQLVEDPWDICETALLGKILCKGEVIRIIEKGVIIKLSHGIEAFAPKRHSIKLDGSQISKAEVLDFKILEVNRVLRKVFVSHTNTFSTISNLSKKRHFKKHQKTK